MRLEYKYIVGTHIMFYEIDMVEEHIQSIVNASTQVENPENITVKLLFNISQYFEKIDLVKITKENLIEKFNLLVDKLKSSGVTVNSEIYSNNDIPLTMVEFRRDLNYFGCQDNDYIIWGESDCLLPIETFLILDMIKNYANSQEIYRYITTFAVRKMWDKSWEPIEHVDMTDKPLHPRTLPDGSLNPESFSQPYSINYTMTIDEMNEINLKAKSLDLRILRSPKFDGSGLVISSDLIKAGVNIPLGIFGLVGEDTAFMQNCLQIMSSNYFQFVVKNILKVHNRMHPKKRLYALDMFSKQQSTQREKGDWYSKLRDINRANLEMLGPKQNKFYTYNDFLKQL